MRWQSIDCVQCLKSEPAKVHPGRRQRPPRPRWRCTCIPLNVNADQCWQRAAIQSSDIGADATESKFAGRDTRGSRTRLGRRSDPGVGADSRVDPELPSRAVWKGPSSSPDGEDWPPSSHRRVRSVPVSSQSGVAARPSWESAASCSSSLQSSYFAVASSCNDVVSTFTLSCANLNHYPSAGRPAHSRGTSYAFGRRVRSNGACRRSIASWKPGFDGSRKVMAS